MVWMIKPVSMTIASPLIPKLRAGLNRGPGRKILNAVVFRGGRHVGIGCDEAHLAHLHSKRQAVGDFKLETFVLDGSAAESAADLNTPVVRVLGYDRPSRDRIRTHLY